MGVTRAWAATHPAAIRHAADHAGGEEVERDHLQNVGKERLDLRGMWCGRVHASKVPAHEHVWPPAHAVAISATTRPLHNLL